MYIKEIQLSTNHLKETELFYTKSLELKIRHKGQHSISFYAGNSVLCFVKNEYVSHPVYHFAFNIPGHQFKEALIWLKARIKLLSVNGLEIVDFPRWNAHSIYFYDNNQNVLEWIARHDLKYETYLSFRGESVKCISEIGLVADDVLGYADQLMADYQVPVFAKQIPHEKFTVLGDEQALLILSETGREWFPTDIPCKKFPLSVTLGFGMNRNDKVIVYG